MININVAAVVFEVLVKNRYKADRDYRKYLEVVKHSPNDLHLQALLSKAKVFVPIFSYNNSVQLLLILVKMTQDLIKDYSVHNVVISGCF